MGENIFDLRYRSASLATKPTGDVEHELAVFIVRILVKDLASHRILERLIEWETELAGRTINAFRSRRDRKPNANATNATNATTTPPPIKSLLFLRSSALTTLEKPILAPKR